jgi:hypothetical protein
VGCLVGITFPFEGMRLARLSVGPSPNRQWPLMRLDALQSFINGEAACLLVGKLPSRLAVSSQPGRSTSPPAPELDESAGSSSQARVSSPEYVTAISPPEHPISRAPGSFPEVSFPIATSAHESTF